MKNSRNLIIDLCITAAASAILAITKADVCSESSGAPFIELTQESCHNSLGFDKFQVQSSKKISWNKPLNGKIKFTFTGNQG